jgi:putative hydrolase of the HAD superfamily
MITTLFWDLGGVLLSNGWDRDARRRACAQFALDWEDFQDRHEHVVDDFETGRMDLQTYLDRTVFFEPRAFTLADFKAFMFAQSREAPAPFALARQLHERGRYRLGVINNESLELNRYRIERFGLGECFALFFSSCFVHLRKPDPAIYRLALEVTQTPADQALIVDDRAINVEAAERVGMHAIQFRDIDQLRACLADLGVDVAESPEPTSS